MHLIQIPATKGAEGVSPLVSLWPEIAPLLAKSAERSHGVTTVEHEFEELKALKKQLWVIVIQEGGQNKITAAGITSLQFHPGGAKTANLEMIGGDNMKSWFSLKDQIESWAKAEGCNEVRLFARKGWAKELPDYDLRAYVLSKKI